MARSVGLHNRRKRRRVLVETSASSRDRIIMGVDYSTTVAYGVAVGREELPGSFVNKIKEFSPYNSDDMEDVQSYLDSLGYSVTVSVEGNQWSGETFFLFYDPEYYYTLGKWHQEESHIALKDVNVQNETILQLFRLAAFLNKPQQVSWHVFSNVS